MKQHLYVMLSHTPTKMGQFIRFFTGEEYNHVSLCIDGSLKQFVSFARYHIDVPLAGGYVTEPAARLLSCGNSMPVRIFQIEITSTDAHKLDALFKMADHTPLIYNSLGALLSSCHIRCPVPGAYTCLEFANAILGTPFLTIGKLADALKPWEIYRGDLFEIIKHGDNHNSIFFEKRGLRKGTLDTVIHFKTLLWRILRLERPHDPIAASALNIIINTKSQ